MLYLIIWTLAMSSIFNNIAMRGYSILENESFKADVERIDAGFETLTRKSDSVLRDWAVWDDLYRYIHVPYSAFEESNIGANFFEEQELDYLFIYDRNDELISGFEVDSDGVMTASNQEDISEIVLANKNNNGLMLHNGRPLIYSSTEVTNTSGVSPRRGLLCFAFYLDHSHVESLASDLEVELRFVSSSESIRPDEELITYHEHDDFRTALFKYPYENDPHGIALQLIHPLSITSLGQKTMRDVLIVSVVAFVLISFILYIFVRRYMNRIRSLSRDVGEIAHNQDLGKRVDVESNDEITELTLDINYMLDRIEIMNDQLVEYAAFDIMTGVLNRRVGFEKLEDLLDAFRDSQNDLTICYVDINNLKVVNDSLGHKYGDELIISVSSTIKEHIRGGDMICRLGGDEFLVIFPNCSIDQAHQVMERIESNLGVLQCGKHKSYPITISKGFMKYDGEMDIHDFVEEADLNMYKDKHIKKQLELK